MKKLLFISLLLACYPTTPIEANENQPKAVSKVSKKKNTVLARAFKKFPELKKEYVLLLKKWKKLPKEEQKTERTKWFRSHPKFKKFYLKLLKNKYKTTK